MFKQPITDQVKKSKKGRLSLEVINGEYATIEEGHGNPKEVTLELVIKYCLLQKCMLLFRNMISQIQQSYSAVLSVD